jgi:DNA-binding CsgD family transcriptional regulator
VMPVPALAAAGVLAAELVRRGRTAEANLVVESTRGIVSQLVDHLGPGAGPAVTDLILADAALARDRGDFATMHEALDRAEGFASAVGREDEIALLRTQMALAERSALAVPESVSFTDAVASVNLLRTVLSLTNEDRALLIRLRGRETQKSIERELGLKPGELRGRVTRLYAKLRVTTRPDAVRRGKQLQVW